MLISLIECARRCEYCRISDMFRASKAMNLSCGIGRYYVAQGCDNE